MMKSGKMNIQEPAGTYLVGYWKELVENLAKEIEGVEGDLWAAPDIASIIQVTGELKYEQNEPYDENSYPMNCYCGTWNNRKVFVDVNSKDGWEIR